MGKKNENETARSAAYLAYYSKIQKVLQYICLMKINSVCFSLKLKAKIEH